MPAGGSDIESVRFAGDSNRTWTREVDFLGAGRLSLPVVGRTALGSEWLKRAIDVAVAAVLLPSLAPVLLLIGALVRLSSPGPALYRSWRVGKRGREFTLWKFRSMYVGSRDEPDAITRGGMRVKNPDDPRITRLGAVLRRFSLDELPQLVNVLRGEMSLVGPRPLPWFELQGDGVAEDIESWREKRLEVLPGMTGLWQISGRSELMFERLVELDVAYLERRSLAQDLRILLRTPHAVLTGRGAY